MWKKSQSLRGEMLALGSGPHSQKKKKKKAARRREAQVQRRQRQRLHQTGFKLTAQLLDSQDPKYHPGARNHSRATQTGPDFKETGCRR